MRWWMLDNWPSNNNKDVCACCCVRFFASPRTGAHQAPLSMGFSRQEYWSALPFPPPGDVSNPGIEPMFLVAPALQTESLLLSPQGQSTIKTTIFLCLSFLWCKYFPYGQFPVSNLALLNGDLKRMLTTVPLGQNKPTPAHRCINLLMQMHGLGP